ncbi:MAG: hypothetical protein DRI71_10500 [Bacteroidetes bacterium]|nr:MAG: hypothetical protein DRI71_10500 [Bacteroidota bacterium]
MTKKPKHSKPVPDKKKRKFPPELIKKRRKENHCLNCGEDFDEGVNYCPHCGQENNHNRVSFGTLILDFLNNYFSFDSKFSLSLLPFFFEPGYLTKKFIEGKRASFVNPIRLYLVISLIFFFVFSMVSSDLIQDSIKDIDQGVEELPDSTKVNLDKILLGDLSGLEADSTYKFAPDTNDSTDRIITYSVTKPDADNDFLSEENFAVYMRLREDYEVSVDNLLDSLNTDSLTSFQYNLTKKLIRLDRAENQVVISQLLKNLPLMMIFILPIFAFLLMLFYLRRNQYYITHLIHALHLHSFAYVVYGFSFVAAMYWLPTGAGGWAIFISLILVSTHSYMSFLKVYGQGWFKTLVKFNVIGLLYSFLLIFALLVEMFFAVATY